MTLTACRCDTRLSQLVRTVDGYNLVKFAAELNPNSQAYLIFRVRVTCLHRK